MIYRSLMFTPGTNKERLLKSVSSEADALLWDLEDAVHPDEKAAARAVIQEALDELEDKPAKPIFLRVNQYGTEWYAEDVKLARHENVNGIMLPKAESARQVQETWDGMGANGELIVLVETAVGIVRLEDIFSNPNVSGVAFGAIDYAVDADLTLTEAGLEAIYARSRIVTYAKAAGIDGIYDTVFADIHNTESLQKRAVSARALGFNGQMAVHPKQIETIHEVYSPSREDIDWAVTVLHHAEHEAKGAGVFMLDGKMVDRPIIEKAKQIYQAAERYQLIIGG
ncbi:HpcH/HpaI aldolase/citrate lyase family protein [Planococcus glaciei]|uniref:HpcH/HpaI aldolase/citrate lyase family protein n=1 Tax=Planococcus glaciei TaxID=459472 RepID=UPI001C72AA88|nr:CoA ester lyase [Planococcus glaciei]MBX0314706.1 CoA ester lyase [Planococcus glaciei]